MSKLAKTWCKAFRQGEKGFTLIELLVVVAILGALAAVVVLNVGKFMGSGKCEAYQTERHNVQTAIMANAADNDGTCPAAGDLAPLDPYLVGGSSAVHYGFTIGDNCTCVEPGSTPCP